VVETVAGRDRVLFVDDEPHLLAALRRLLRSESERWELHFVSSGAEALALFDRQPIDAIVSDMRMPGMNGAQLLATVQREHPGTARIILSGQADRASVVSSIGSAQQFLAKPCDAAALTAAITRALAVRPGLTDPGLRELIGGVSSLPSAPSVLRDLITLTRAPQVDLAAVAQILAGDVAAGAAVLKLVNSAFFGLARPISTIAAAVELLGLDTVQILILTGSLSRPSTVLSRRGPIEALSELAGRRAMIGRRITDHQSWSRADRHLAVLACRFRDIGGLVLAEGRPDAAAWLAARPESDPRSADPARTAQLERTAYGCTVPEAGAYLLGLWGFPTPIVQAVAGQPVLGAPATATAIAQVVDLAHRQALDPGRSPGGGPKVDSGQPFSLSGGR
jgi:HD-like signal output (HDOD) protein/CheY-like chemotaxis protein